MIDKNIKVCFIKNNNLINRNININKKVKSDFGKNMTNKNNYNFYNNDYGINIEDLF